MTRNINNSRKQRIIILKDHYTTRSIPSWFRKTSNEKIQKFIVLKIGRKTTTTRNKP